MPVTRLLRTEEDLSSWVRRNPRSVDLGFAVLIGLLLAAMVLWENFETVPYHIAFVSLAVVYGFRAWSVPVTAAALLAISATTGLILVERYRAGAIDLEELSEIFLMPMILVAMAWHARRRDAMQRQVQAYADAERARWLREQEFLRDCSHALRTPLTVARGHVELIRDFRDAQEFESDVAIILGELDHLNRLASRLLAIADVERPDRCTDRSSTSVSWSEAPRPVGRPPWTVGGSARSTGRPGSSPTANDLSQHSTPSSRMPSRPRMTAA